MGEALLMKGNEAVAEAAIRAGCRYFFGYPITPQSELPEYMSRRLPEVGGVFLQAESEIAAINMVFGAAGAGARVMTSSSGPGISLKQEGISYIAGADLPCVIVDMMRGGPGLGGIQPAQSDYFQVVKGGGHGDYRLIVYAPASVQEMVDVALEAFDISDRYRVPVMILGDGLLGQMMEPVEFRDIAAKRAESKPWATTGAAGRSPNLVSSFEIDPEKLNIKNQERGKRYREIEAREARYEIIGEGESDIYMVAYGTMSRVCRAAMGKARAEGLRVGLIRPVTLWPYPIEAFERVMVGAKAFLAVEMSMGQMVEDVRLSVNGRRPVHFFGKTGGVVPTPKGILEKIREIAAEGICKGRGLRRDA